MNKLIRALIAGWGAKKIGGGCITTIIVFIIIYYALGTCNSRPVQTVPQKNSGIQAPAQKTLQVSRAGRLIGGQKFMIAKM